MSLISPDRARCQAEKPNGQTFMTLGGSHKMIRCSSRPSVVVTEMKPGNDGQRGSMSLCRDCLPILLKQMGNDNFLIEALRP